jgi:transposase-like protein
MRYLASEKLEIIRLVEEPVLPVRRTLEKIGIPRATFYRWYDLYQVAGPQALHDRHPKPDRVWNRIPDDVRERIIKLALDESALSPRELAVRFTRVTVARACGLGSSSARIESVARLGGVSTRKFSFTNVKLSDPLWNGAGA